MLRMGHGGFSMVELIVTMLIVAILAAVAIPAYSQYVRKSRRTDAKSALMDLASLEERYFSTNNAYSATSTDLGYAAFPATVGNGYYTVAAPTVVPATQTLAATYSITATVIPGIDQAKDTQCASFTISSAGVQTALTSAAVDNSQTCWH